MLKHLLAPMAVLALSACGSGEKSTTIGGATYSSNDRDGTASITTDKGSLTTAEGAAAANFQMPAFAPKYPGATIVGVIRSESDGTTRHMVNMQSTDSIGKVAAFYKDGFVRAGLKTTSEMMTADGGMMSAEGDGRKVSIAISQDEGKTAAIVTYSGD